jgi:hypothetical protein
MVDVFPECFLEVEDETGNYRLSGLKETLSSRAAGAILSEQSRTMGRKAVNVTFGGNAPGAHLR